MMNGVNTSSQSILTDATLPRASSSSDSNIEVGQERPAQRSRGFLCGVISYGGCGLVSILLAATVIGCIAYHYYEITPDHLFDFGICKKINPDNSFVLEMKNTSYENGSKAELVCKIVNVGFQYQKVYWIGPNFEVEVRSGIKIKTDKYDAISSVESTEEKVSFSCLSIFPRNGTVTVTVQTMTLILRPNVAHEGQYTCKTNYSVPIGPYSDQKQSSESFYLTMNK